MWAGRALEVVKLGVWVVGMGVVDCGGCIVRAVWGLMSIRVTTNIFR